MMRKLSTRYRESLRSQAPSVVDRLVQVNIINFHTAARYACRDCLEPFLKIPNFWTLQLALRRYCLFQSIPKRPSIRVGDLTRPKAAIALFQNRLRFVERLTYSACFGRFLTDLSNVRQSCSASLDRESRGCFAGNWLADSIKLSFAEDESYSSHQEPRGYYRPDCMADRRDCLSDCRQWALASVQKRSCTRSFFAPINDSRLRFDSCCWL